MLLMNPVQKRRQFFIGVILQGVLQVQMVQRLHNFLRYPFGQNRAQNQGDADHHTERMQHSHHQNHQRLPADRNPQDTSVRQPFRLIDSAFQQSV